MATSKSTVIVLAVALLIRVAAAFWWQSGANDGELFRFGDSHSYWVLASRIGHGQTYEYGSKNALVFRAPLYPIFLSPFTLLQNASTGVMAGRISGCLLGVFCVGLVMAAAKRLGGERSAFLAGCLAALYPGAIGMSVFILSESIFCPLLLLAVICWSFAVHSIRFQGDTSFPDNRRGLEPDLKWSLLSGIATGLACLARPSFILWPAWIGLASLLYSDNRRRQVVRLAMLAIGITLTMVPWWIRNYWVTQAFVPTTLQVGASLYDGWHPQASGLSDENMQFVDQFISEQLAMDAQSQAPLKSTFEYRLNQRLLWAAVQWAGKNPSDAVRLGMVKLRQTWSPWPTAGQFKNRWIWISESIGFLVIVAAGVLGWWHCRTRGWIAHVYIQPCLYFGLLHTVFVGSVRYRQPAVLVLCVLAGCGLSWLSSRITQKKSVSNHLPENGPSGEYGS